MSRGRIGPLRRMTFEILELRKLLSTVNVTDFGPRPNDGQNDSGAIQAAINNSHPGDTIAFAGGNYDIGGSITLKGNRNYTGGGSAILKGDPNVQIFQAHEDNIRIADFTFDGKPIFFDKPGQRNMASGIVIDSNIFHLRASGCNNNGITFTTGLRNSSITNNRFDPMQGENGIYGYYWDNLRIANNQFFNGTEGIHVVDQSNNSGGLTIEQNHFSSLHRMGVEIQGGGNNTLVQDNYYENPVMFGEFNRNNDTFAYSIISDKSNNTVVRRNTAIMPTSGNSPDGTGVRIVFELGGHNVQCYDNYSVGGNHIIAGNGNGASGAARDNRVSGFRQAPGNANGAGLQFANNGPNVQLSWDINRPKPGPHGRLAGDSASVQKEPSSRGSDNYTYLTDLNWSSAKSSWGPVEKNRSNGRLDSRDGGAIRLGGRSYSSGLGVAGDSQVVYRLDGDYSRFFSDVGVDEYAGNQGSVVFRVFGDGRKVYDSGIMTGKTKTRGLNINVEGVRELKLVTTDGGNGIKSDHADWAAARVVKR